MILLDFNQVALSNILVFKQDLKSGIDTENIMRYAILSAIKTIKSTYNKNEYGEFIICSDGGNYWRKDIFPYYKSKRKSNREKDDLDWEVIFSILNKLTDEIKLNFPYKFLQLPKIEADDIIAIIAKYVPRNSVAQGLYGDDEKTIIISSDKDFTQLHNIPGTYQFSPATKQLLKYNKKEIEEYIITHIVKGDSGDGIPNILSPDDIFETGVRQKSIYAKDLERFYELGRDGCLTEDMKNNWDRNESLVSFNKIPSNIKDQILEAFNNYVILGDNNKIFNYLVKNKCKNLLDDIHKF